MCDACNLRINSGVTSVVTKCQRVLAKKFPFMIHHFITLQKMKYEVHTKLSQIAYQIQIWYAICDNLV